MVILRGVSTTTLGTLPTQAGRLIFDTTSLTLKYNTGVVDQELVTSTFAGPVGINTTNPDRVLELNSANGQDLRLTYNSSAGNDTTYTDFNVTSAGILQIEPTGNQIELPGTTSLKIDGANGSTVGLILGSTLVTSTGTELNYLHGLTPGTASASHALVTDSSNNLTGLNDFQATQITATTADLTTVNATTLNGTLGTASQPNITSVGTLSNLAVTGTLTLNGTALSVTGTELDYLHGITPGTASAGLALVTDSSNNISGINDLSAANLTGTTSITTPTLNVTNEINLTVTSSVGDTTLYPLVITRETTGTPAVGLGVGMDFQVENSNNVDTVFGNVSIRASNITSGSETGLLSIGLAVGGTLTEDLVTVDSTGTIYAFQLSETSDVRMKKNIEDANPQDSLDKILNLRVRDFVFKKDPEEKVHRGVIAQELMNVMPSAVIISEKEDLIDYHSIQLQPIVFSLVQAFQELYKQVNGRYHNSDESDSSSESEESDLESESDNDNTQNNLPSPNVTPTPPTSPVNVTTPTSPDSITIPTSPVNVTTPILPDSTTTPTSPVNVTTPTSTSTDSTTTPTSPVNVTTPTSTDSTTTPTSPVNVIPSASNSPVNVTPPTSPVNTSTDSTTTPTSPVNVTPLTSPVNISTDSTTTPTSPVNVTTSTDSTTTPTSTDSTTTSSITPIVTDSTTTPSTTTPTSTDSITTPTSTTPIVTDSTTTPSTTTPTVTDSITSSISSVNTTTTS
jgi:hypothetical protein